MKIPLLEYLDKLEATAKAAGNPRYSGDERGPVSLIVSQNEYQHILATQPKATLALIAKLRETVGLLCSCIQWVPDTNVLDHVGAAASTIEVPE